MKLHFSVLVLSCALSACAFFEEPVEDLGSLVTSAPADAVPAAAPRVLQTPPPPPSPAPVASNPTPTATPAANSQTATAINSSAATEGSFFTVVTLFDIPESAKNLSIIHFTDRNRRREQALCEALLDKFPPTPASNVPANASNLIVWPVSVQPGNTCREMMGAYEPIDISNKVAETVNSDATGPFVLSRNTSSDQRLIYDLSSVRNRAMADGLAGWQSIVDTPPTSWPPYSRAR